MRIERHIETPLPRDGLERDAIEAVSEILAPLFEDAAGERSALLVTSSDAGSSTAIHFWSEARRVGVAVASPELFPWCLANAPCGALARRFGIRGASLTWLGGADALESAWEWASDRLAGAEFDRVFVVDVTFKPGARHLRAWRLQQADDTLEA